MRDALIVSIRAIDEPAVDSVAATVAVLITAVVNPIEAKAYRHRVVDGRDKAVIHDGYAAPGTEAKAAAPHMAGISDTEKQMRLQLKTVVGVIAGLLDRHRFGRARKRQKAGDNEKSQTKKSNESALHSSAIDRLCPKTNGGGMAAAASVARIGGRC